MAPLPSQAAIVFSAPEEQPPAPQPEPECQSASDCLTAAEDRENEGDYTAAGRAYRKAFDKLRPAKQPANEGARIAMFCSDAYRQAFDIDGNVAHLDAADECLRGWLELAGPDTKATLAARVDGDRKQLEEVRKPLKDAEAARLDGDRTQEAEHLTQVIEAMKAQQRPRPAIARLEVRHADAEIAALDAQPAEAKDKEEQLRKLEATQISLEECRKQLPEEDTSPEALLLDQRLADIQTRIDDTNAAIAAEEEVIDTPPPPPPPTPTPIDPDGKKDDEERRQRVKAITLLSVGGVVAVAGAGLLGEGVAFSSVATRLGDAEEAKADGLEQQYGDSYPRDRFDADLQRFRDEARIRNIGFIAGGAVLLAGGLATGIAGAVLLKKSRTKRSGAQEKLVLIPTVSPSQLHLSLTTRF